MELDRRLKKAGKSSTPSKQRHLGESSGTVTMDWVTYRDNELGNVQGQ